MWQMFDHPNGIYSLVLPPGWKQELRGSSAGFSHSDGSKGAITVSCLAPPAGQDANPIAFINDVVRTKLPPDEGQVGAIVECPCASQAVRIAYCNYHCKRDYWRIWIVSRADRLLFVTYNCDPSLKGLEDKTVDHIVSSIRLA